MPLSTRNWGMYSAHRLTEYLFENKSFRQVAVARKPTRRRSYIISGTLEHLCVWGSQGPTSVIPRGQGHSAHLIPRCGFTEAQRLHPDEVPSI
ncbi:MAG: hypothetical protein MZV63_57770 [Marinilabiliales bacterium]|nr:hypothetical protein [Marinilabiliales bacterium]